MPQEGKEMNRLKELITELCPNGVEYQELNQISEMKRGTSITKKDIIEGTTPVISGGKRTRLLLR